MLKGMPFFGKLSVGAGKLFSRIPLSPDHWTAFSIVFALLGAGFLIDGSPLIAAVLFLISFACDFIDGAVARERRQTTALGAYIDGMSDRGVEFLLIVGLALYPMPFVLLPHYVWAISVLFFGTCMTTFAKAYADHRKAISGQDVENLNGFFQRGERAAILFLVLVLLPFEPEWSVYLLILASVLSALTVLQKFVYVVEKSSSKN